MPVGAEAKLSNNTGVILDRETNMLDSIPPSTSHLFEEDSLAELFKQHGRVPENSEQTPATLQPTAGRSEPPVTAAAGAPSAAAAACLSSYATPDQALLSTAPENGTSQGNIARGPIPIRLSAAARLHRAPIATLPLTLRQWQF
nr:unnamed protein product [Callosobruchus analis]